MALLYRPINGLAGTITVTVYDRTSGFSFTPITLNVADFDEDDEPSAFSSVFEDVNDELIHDYYGYRKVISFSLYNNIEDTESADAMLPKIISFINFINFINTSPETFRMSIECRSGLVLQDVVFVGNFKLEEITKKANAGQIINLTFKNRTCGDLDYSIEAFVDYLVLESGDNILLETGFDLLAETYTIT